MHVVSKPQNTPYTNTGFNKINNSRLPYLLSVFRFVLIVSILMGVVASDAYFWHPETVKTNLNYIQIKSILNKM